MNLKQELKYAILHKYFMDHEVDPNDVDYELGFTRGMFFAINVINKVLRDEEES